VAADPARDPDQHPPQLRIPHHLTPAHGTIRLDRLRVAHIADMFDTIAERNKRNKRNERNERNERIAEARASDDPGVRASVKGARTLGAASMQRIRATLRKAFNDAIRQYQPIITINPAAFVELPAGRRPKALVWTPERVARWSETGEIPSKVMVWTPEQTGRFLDHAVHDRLYPLYHLITFRGLRRGEACGARWSELDLANGTLAVSLQLLQHGWATSLEKPKTDDSDAIIALDTATIAVLTVHRRNEQAEQDAAGEAWPDTGLIFTKPDGQPLHPADVTDRFKQLAAEAGLPPIRLHDLRHGAATLALAAGTDMKVVQAMLRHSSITITADTYTTVLPEVARQAAEATARMIPLQNRRSLGLPSGSQTSTNDETRPPGTGERAGQIGSEGCTVRDSNPEPAD